MEMGRDRRKDTQKPERPRNRRAGLGEAETEVEEARTRQTDRSWYGRLVTEVLPMLDLLRVLTHRPGNHGD